MLRIGTPRVRVQPLGSPARGGGVRSDEDVYLKVKDDLVRYATFLVGPFEAEDVVSTVVLRRLQQGSLGELADARSYLFRAVANEANGLRRRRRIEPLNSFEVAAPGADGEAVDMARALLGLPVRQRAVVFLTYWMGYTTQEVSVMLGIGHGTAKRYLHLARRKLRKALS